MPMSTTNTAMDARGRSFIIDKVHKAFTVKIEDLTIAFMSKSKARTLLYLATVHQSYTRRLRCGKPFPTHFGRAGQAVKLAALLGKYPRALAGRCFRKISPHSSSAVR
jgi:hypothetical protein